MPPREIIWLGIVDTILELDTNIGYYTGNCAQLCCIDAASLRKWAVMLHQSKCNDAASLQNQCINENVWKFYWHFCEKFEKFEILQWCSIVAKRQWCCIIAKCNNAALLQYYGNTNNMSSDAASLCTIGHVFFILDLPFWILRQYHLLYIYIIFKLKYLSNKTW